MDLKNNNIITDLKVFLITILLFCFQFIERMDKETSKIWQMFSDKLKAFIFKRTQDIEITNDILQEVFIKIHTKIDTLKEDTKLQSWIYQITRNTINDHFRKKGFTDKENKELISEEDEQESESMLKIAQGLYEFMDNLPEKYCDALCKTEFEGLSQVDYAKETGISNSGAKSRVQRGRAMIKDMLMKCCHFQFDKYGTIIDYHPITCCCCHQYFEEYPEER